MVSEVFIKPLLILSGALLIGNVIQWGYASSLKYKLSVQELATAKVATEYAEYKVKKERELVLELHKVEVIYQKDQESADKAYDDLLGKYRAADLKLRKRFTCEARPAHSPEASSAGEGEEGGLLREDGEFLIGEAKRADDVTRELNLAKDHIEVLERVINGR